MQKKLIKKKNIRKEEVQGGNKTARLYRRKNARVKKALSFSTPKSKKYT